MKHIVLLLALTCTAFFSSAQQQNCLSFDGSNDYVYCTLPTVFTDLANNDFTFEAWVKSQSSVTNRVFFAQQDNSNFATLLIAGNLIFYVKVANVTYSSSVTLLPQGQWVHIAATWDASLHLPVIYVNGVKQSGTAAGSSSSGINNTMTLGSRTDGLQVFTGEMDEVRIWNTVRKECEIRSMMHSVSAGNEAELIHYYNFNRGTAGGSNPTFTLLPDLAGTNPGTLMDFNLSGASSNWVTSGASLTAAGPQNAYETSFSDTICEGDTYVFGTQNLTAAGAYQETFTSLEGCDSLVTLQLMVRAVHMPPVMQTACSSYYWEQTGETYLTSGIYTDTLAGSFGCDSILILDLTINQPTASSIQIESCGSYNWAQTGETYTVSGLYYDTIPNAGGCDSVITLDLTILNASTSTQQANSCISYMWAQTGETYTTSGFYCDTIPNVVGCDSIITLDLTILEPTSFSFTASACGSYYWEQTGIAYGFSGTYTDTILNASGCDSVVTLHLLIHQLPEATLVHDGQGTLSVNPNADMIQWMDCSTGQTISQLNGLSTFTPVENGSFAVIVENTMTLCRDTSDCFTVDFIGLGEHNLVDLHLAPNPAHDQVTLQFSGEAASLTVLDTQGKHVLTQTVENGGQIPLTGLESGIYFFRLQSTYGSQMQRLVKE